MGHPNSLGVRLAARGFIAPGAPCQSLSSGPGNSGVVTPEHERMNPDARHEVMRPLKVGDHSPVMFPLIMLDGLERCPAKKVHGHLTSS